MKLSTLFNAKCDANKSTRTKNGHVDRIIYSVNDHNFVDGQFLFAICKCVLFYGTRNFNKRIRLSEAPSNVVLNIFVTILVIFHPVTG